jgi:hypothetical protein
MNGMTLEEYEKYLRILVTDTDRLESVLKKSEQLIIDKQPPVDTLAKDSLKIKIK